MKLCRPSFGCPLHGTTACRACPAPHAYQQLYTSGQAVPPAQLIAVWFPRTATGQQWTAQTPAPPVPYQAIITPSRSLEEMQDDIVARHEEVADNWYAAQDRDARYREQWRAKQRDLTLADAGDND